MVMVVVVMDTVNIMLGTLGFSWMITCLSNVVSLEAEARRLVGYWGSVDSSDVG